MPDTEFVPTADSKPAGPQLVVVEPFDDYSKGEVIDDAKTVAQVLASEWAGHVVRRA